MRFIFLIISVFLIFHNSGSAQNNISATSEEQPILLKNPSFEDFPRIGYTPDRWYDCGFSGETEVDIHPEFNSLFKVDKTAFHGDTYIGMVVRENDTYEAVGQRLSKPLIAGNCYEFTIHLARSPMYMSIGRSDKNAGEDVNYATPARLRIWGGKGYCSKVEELASSSLIINSRWLEFNFRFEPTQTFSYITFEAFYQTPHLFPYNGNILLDNAQPIVPVPCKEEPAIAVAEPVPTPTNPTAKTPEPKERPDQPTIKETKPTEQTAKIQGQSKRDLRVGQTILLKNLQFDADSTVIPPRSYESINSLLDFLTENKDLKIEVGGHTNNQPEHKYCDYISTERAKSVANYLMERGISEDRLEYKGYGKRKPIFSNKTAYGRRQNQRVEIKILGFKGDI